MSAFEDFVNLELPRRPTLLTEEITSYQGDPNAGGAPSIIQNSPKGTFYLNNIDNSLWRKTSASVGSWQVVGATPDATTADVTYYVNSSTGSDSNDGLSSGSPFLTIQHAVSLVPRVIRHFVQINVASGTYAGFFIYGRTVDPAPGASSIAAFSVKGTYVNATVATGSATGTLTSTTTGSSVTRTVLGDTSNNLTVNDVKCKILKMTTGANAGTQLPITANDAHTITVCSNGALGAIGDSYVILDWGSVINTSVQPGGFYLPGEGAFLADLDVGIGISNNSTSYYQGVAIEGFKIELSVGFPYSIWSVNNTGQTSFYTCHIGTSQGFGVEMYGCESRMSSCVFDATTGSPGDNNFAYIMDGGPNGEQSLDNCLITSSNGPNPNPAFMVQPSSGGQLLIFDCCVENYVIGMKIIAGGGLNVDITGTTFAITGSEGILCSNNYGHNNNSATYLFCNGVSFNGCSSALLLDNSCTAHLIGVVGTTNGTGWQLETGARIKVDTTTTLTGTSEMTLDGVSHTLSEMRANTPPLIMSPYGTIIFEYATDYP